MLLMEKLTITEPHCHHVAIIDSTAHVTNRAIHLSLLRVFLFVCHCSRSSRARQQYQFMWWGPLFKICPSAVHCGRAQGHKNAMRADQNAMRG